MKVLNIHQEENPEDVFQGNKKAVEGKGRKKTTNIVLNIDIQ